MIWFSRVLSLEWVNNLTNNEVILLTTLIGGVMAIVGGLCYYALTNKQINNSLVWTLGITMVLICLTLSVSLINTSLDRTVSQTNYQPTNTPIPAIVNEPPKPTQSTGLGQEDSNAFKQLPAGEVGDF